MKNISMMSIATTRTGSAGKALVLASVAWEGPFSRVAWDVVGSDFRVAQAVGSRGAAEQLASAWAHEPERNAE